MAGPLRAVWTNKCGEEGRRGCHTAGYLGAHTGGCHHDFKPVSHQLLHFFLYFARKTTTVNNLKIRPSFKVLISLVFY